MSSRQLVFSAIAGCLLQLLPVNAQDSPASDSDLQRRSQSAGIRLFQRGAWGIVGIELINRGDEPTEVLTGLYFDGDTLAQFSRRVWLPAKGRRVTWIPVKPPQDGPKELTINPFLYSVDGDSQALIKSDKELKFEAEILPYLESPATVLIDDWYRDDKPSLIETKELAIALRLSARYTRTIIEINPDDVPAFAEGLDAVDHVVLAGNQIADSPGGLHCIRTWLHRGGQLLILLDQVDVSTVELLLGDAIQIAEVDRVRLTELQLKNVLKNQLIGSQLSFEDPVEFVRVIAPDAEVTHEVDGWPAAFRQNIGQGRVLLTTLSANAWMRPREAHEQVEKLDRNSAFIGREGLDEVADYLTRPLASPPVTTEDLESFLSPQIGYRIPRRSTVAVVLASFWIALIGLGFWMLRRAQLERLAIIGPVLACLAAVPLIVMGERARHAIPPTAAIAEIVQVGPGSTTINSHGVVAMFVPEPTRGTIGSDSRLIIPKRERLAGSIRRMVLTDLDRWHWENLTLPAGLHFATTQQHASVATTLRATATFGPEGVIGKLESGPFSEPTDALIATTTQHAMAIHFSLDRTSLPGTFTATNDDVLEPGSYSTDRLLTDEQRRRTAVYQSMFRSQVEFRYPNRPTLFAWTRPIGDRPTFPDSMEQSHTSLLVVPLEFRSPAPNTDVFLPSPLLPFETVATDKGSKATAYDARTGQWQKTSYSSTTMLRFAIPGPLLPMQATGGKLSIRIRAPMRRVELATGTAGEPVVLTSIEDAVGSYEFPIEQADALQIDEDGGLHVRLTVGDVQGSQDVKTSGVDRSWKMDFIRLELSGRTLDDTDRVD